MTACIRQGQRLPPVTLAELRHGEVITLRVEPLLAGKRSLLIGVPGAFTPVCSERHLPQFIEAADKLRRAGFDQLLVIAPSDPFSMAAWAQQVDPEGKLRFLSDGNLDFTRKAGLTSHERALFLGERGCRYTMIVQDAVVERLNIEASVLDVTCSRAAAVLELAD